MTSQTSNPSRKTGVPGVCSGLLQQSDASRFEPCIAHASSRGTYASFRSWNVYAKGSPAEPWTETMEPYTYESGERELSDPSIPAGA
jgi:hypothetical protein